MILVNNFIFIQARMGSSRLPGKTLKILNGKPLIMHVIQRLRLVDNCKIVLLTSDSVKDNELHSWCDKNDILCFRGSEENVLQRYFLAAKHYKADNIIRATGDNPLVDPYFAKRLLEKHTIYDADYSSNKSEIGSNLPDGLGVEIFTFNALKISLENSTSPHHFEHVNEYILENRSLFKVFKDSNVGGLIDHSDNRLTVDTNDDFLRTEDVFNHKNFTIDINYENLLELTE